MPGKPAARKTDPTTHLTTPLSPGPGSPTVMIGNLAAWRAKIDQHACPATSLSGPDGEGAVMMGSPTVFIENQMACRQGDIVVEKPGAALGPTDPILKGLLTVLIGDGGGGGGGGASSAANLLATHQIDIGNHRAKYEKLKQQAEQVGNKGAAKAYKARITEAKGEKAATDFMMQNHPDYQLASGFGVDTGFDQIWVKRDPMGNFEEILIVEAKGPNQKLKKGAAKGDQMSKKWVQNTADEWVKSPTADPETKQIAGQILQAMNGSKPKITGKVIRATEDGGYEEIPCPPPHGGKYN